MVSMGVLSDDFATVDLREDYANLSLPKEANSRGERNGKTNKEKGSHGGKAAADPERFSGDGSAPPRLSVWFSVLILFVACACRGGASAPSLSYKNKHTPRLQMAFSKVNLSSRIFLSKAGKNALKTCRIEMKAYHNSKRAKFVECVPCFRHALLDCCDEI